MHRLFHISWVGTVAILRAPQPPGSRSVFNISADTLGPLGSACWHSGTYFPSSHPLSAGITVSFLVMWEGSRSQIPDSGDSQSQGCVLLYCGHRNRFGGITFSLKTDADLPSPSCKVTTLRNLEQDRSVNKSGRDSESPGDAGVW